MRSDFFYESCGAGSIHAARWMPDTHPKAILQIVHGIAEHVDRYETFARYLNDLGYIVVAEDHMGHGKSIGDVGIQGYFHGGWFSAVEDSYHLMKLMRREYPELPYVMFGHSMGSFMVRTILARHPGSRIAAAVICGTGWQPRTLLKAAVPLSNLICKMNGETNPSEKLNSMVFGSYNKKVEHPRTGYDWLTRDEKIVDAYIADPLCGFTATAGLLRDMMAGIDYIQQPESLNAMRKDLPVFFIAGGDDPVGAYGDGVKEAADAFRHAGMQKVSTRIYPLCRHEILNEINKYEIFEDIAQWLDPIIK